MDHMLPYALLSLSVFALRQAPPGTEVHIRLITPVSSYSSKAGSPVSAVLIAPVTGANGETLLPAGSTIEGTVRRAQPVGYGVVHETAALDLDFKYIVLPDGDNIPVTSRVAQVDNGRERVTREGSIQGVRATSSIAYRASGYIRYALGWEFHAQLALWAIKMLVIQVPEPEIYYPTGAELTLFLTMPALSETHPAYDDPANKLSSEESYNLRDVVAELPYRVYAKSNRPSDLLNVILIGSREQISEAFTAAGWTQAKPTTLKSRILALRSGIEDRGYSAAPMSKLYLNNTPAGMSWQKGLNDFAKRDHIRLWKQAETLDGQEVWIGAATRDVDYAYLRRRLTVTHRIEEDIDRERDKVARDLEFTTCTDVVDWWDRPGSPLNARNATGDLMTTDGRLAVVKVNDCESPRVVQGSGAEPLRIHGNYFQRLLRREILSVRSDFYRTNMYWRTYEGTRWAINAIRKRHRPEDPMEFRPQDQYADSLVTKIRNSSWVR
jgi:hypothetical protein